MSRIVLGVSGGIAAYKACEVLRRLSEAGHEVTVVPTENALEFVGATTFAALSGRPVATDVFTDAATIPHVRLGRHAGLVVVAPATADLVSRAATGRADDLLTNTLLTATCPVLLCPAMHTEMWLHAATQANVATLRARGVAVLNPASGRLAGADTGIGRLPDPAEIVEVALATLAAPDLSRAMARQDLTGLRVAVSAGGTHEAIDPVRFLGNASSGRMGVAIARAAAARGATVTLVAANVSLPMPSSVVVRQVRSTADLAAAMAQIGPTSDVVVMAAAPADFTPTASSGTKLSKHGDSGLELILRQTTDVLAALGRTRQPGQTLVGFAAETIADPDDLVEAGRAKLARKGADLLVVNDVSGGKVFGSDETTVSILDPTGVVAHVSGSKSLAAHRILDAVLADRSKKEFV